MTQNVTMWFDVSCPFAWMTSRWLKEVQKVRDVQVEFTPMSLAILNEGADIPEDYARKMEANWGPARVFARVKDAEPEKVGDLYTAMGEIVHGEGENGKEGPGAYNQVIAKGLEKVGLDPSYADAANTDDADASLKKYHQAAMDAVGEDSGTPVVQIGEGTFFGPVITRLPEGEEAGEIFDAVLRLGAFPYFFEMKRSRSEVPQIEGRS